MSYLLDALKQSQQTDISAEQYDLQSEQLKQQRALTRYRKLALVFGTSLAAFIIVVGGFATGKWLQNEKTITEQVKLAEKVDEKKLAAVANSDTKPQVPQQEVTTQALQGQLVFVQTPNGIQQMLLTPQGQYMAMAPNQGNVVPMNNQPVYTSQPQVNQQGYSQISTNQQHYVQPNYQQQVQNEPNSPQQNTQSAQLDMSKYKVLGRQLNNDQNTANPPEQESVPNTLKNAFAQAVQETQQANDYEVTQGTHHSSRVEPVELLPDGLQRILPPIKYQAHIYSSSADKRWIKLNGRELHEGESIGVLTVREITPEQSVLDFDGYEFSLKALQDWPE